MITTWSWPWWWCGALPQMGAAGKWCSRSETASSYPLQFQLPIRTTFTVIEQMHTVTLNSRISKVCWYNHCGHRNNKALCITWKKKIKIILVSGHYCVLIRKHMNQQRTLWRLRNSVLLKPHNAGRRENKSCPVVASQRAFKADRIPLGMW